MKTSGYRARSVVFFVWRRRRRSCQAHLPRDSRAHNSAVECHLHTVEVVGSNPAVPTNQINNLAILIEVFVPCGLGTD